MSNKAGWERSDVTGKNGVIAGKARSEATAADGELELNSWRIPMAGADLLPSLRTFQPLELNDFAWNNSILTSHSARL